MKKIILLLALLVTANVYAADFDLKATMKEMKLEFKHAAEAQTINEMKEPVVKLKALVNNAKQGFYPQEKRDIFLEGFNKLTVALDNVENSLESGNFDEAKQELRKVDDLRKEYHDKNKGGFWSRLFG